MNRCGLVKVSLGVYLLMGAQVAWGQVATTGPGTTAADAGNLFAAFDVVSVRPQTGSGMILMGVPATPDGIDAGKVTVAELVRYAYGASFIVPIDDSVNGLPGWAKSEYFSVRAKMSDPQMAEFTKLSKGEQQQRREAMLQTMLADRFKLKVHRETKQVPDYELVVAKGGPKFKEDDNDPGRIVDINKNPIQGMFIHKGKLTAQSWCMEQFANFLSVSGAGVGRMVVDKTGLTAKYNFALNYSPRSGSFMPGPPPPPGPEDSGPSIITAIGELGLKLQPGRAMIEVVVVDQVERPTDN